MDKNVMAGTTQQVHKNKLNPPNPTGKGGFGDNPEHRNPGGWDKSKSISYQYNRMIHMTEAEFEEIKNKPKTERTMGERLALKRVLAAEKSLPDMREITDRTEGRAKEFIDHTTDGEKIQFGNMVPRNKAE